MSQKGDYSFLSPKRKSNRTSSLHQLIAAMGQVAYITFTFLLKLSSNDINVSVRSMPFIFCN